MIIQITKQNAKKYGLEEKAAGFWAWVEGTKVKLLGVKQSEVTSVCFLVSIKQASRRQAAKRALSIVNKLNPSEFRKAHASRVFKNMNKLRAA